MKLEQIKGTSKNGKAYTAYYVSIGLYKTPLFFPSVIEQKYIKDYLANTNRKEFQLGDENDEPFLVGDED